ncbi:MAG TPA: methyltransferase domain-containing protein, partial [Limnochordia bacterium]
DPREEELARLECLALVGARPDHAWALSERRADVRRAAYVDLCAEVLARAPTVEGLLDAVAGLELVAEAFRIHLERSPGEPRHPSLEIVRDLADRLRGRPNLIEPQVEFLAYRTAEAWFFGRIVGKSERSWVRHIKKPHSYSSSLPTRFARAVVNIAARPGSRLLDPCCGAGTVLLEAAAVGIEAHGLDIKPALVYASRTNLRHFGYTARVEVGDARTATGHYDAAIVDLPYGRNSAAARGLHEAIVTHLREVAPHLVVVSEADLSDALPRWGWLPWGQARVPKGPHLVRWVFACRRA